MLNYVIVSEFQQGAQIAVQVGYLSGLLILLFRTGFQVNFFYDNGLTVRQFSLKQGVVSAVVRDKMLCKKNGCVTQEVGEMTVLHRAK